MNGVTFEHAAAEQRVMAVSQNACVGMLGEILAQPGLFRRANGAAPQYFRVTIRVESDDMPGAEVVAVIPLANGPRLRAPILKISVRARVDVFVVSQGRLRSRLKLSLRRAIAVLKFVGAAAFVGQVARREDRSRDFFDEFGCRASSIQILTSRNIARTHEGECFAIRRGRRRKWIDALFSDRWMSGLRAARTHQLRGEGGQKDEPSDSSYYVPASGSTAAFCHNFFGQNITPTGLGAPLTVHTQLKTVHCRI